MGYMLQAIINTATFRGRRNLGEQRKRVRENEGATKRRERKRPYVKYRVACCAEFFTYSEVNLAFARRYSGVRKSFVSRKGRREIRGYARILAGTYYLALFLSAGREMI